MKMRFLPMLAIFLTLLACANNALAADALTIVGQGVRTVIVAPDGWKPQVWSDWGGQNMLARHVEQVTGVRVPVVAAASMTIDKQQQYDVRIWVGRQPAVESVIGKQLDAIDADGFMIHVQGRDVYVAGKNWWGTNWAVYDLLET